MYILRHIKQENYDSKMKVKLFSMRFHGIVRVGINSTPEETAFLMQFVWGQTERNALQVYRNIQVTQLFNQLWKLSSISCVKDCDKIKQ